MSMAAAWIAEWVWFGKPLMDTRAVNSSWSASRMTRCRAVRPWRVALRATRDLPSRVRGPVESWALAWLAEIWAGDAIKFLSLRTVAGRLVAGRRQGCGSG